MTPDFDQNRVSRVVWRWREPTQPDRKPDPARSRRVRACVQFAVMLGVSLVFFLLNRWTGKPHAVVAPVVLGLACFVLVSGFLVPPLFDAFDRLMKALGRWAGAGLTWLLLVPFFFLVFVPARVGLLLRGKDPMKRKFRSPETTFWITREKQRTRESYGKQY